MGMTLGIQRIGDPNSGNGVIISTPQSAVFANNQLIAVNGAIGSSHPPCGQNGGDIHCQGNWQTQGGSPTVFINNIPVNRTGDTDSCGHVRLAGSPNIFVG